MTRTARVNCVALSDGVAVSPALSRLASQLGRLEEKIFAGSRVLIKPNFVAPFRAATTDFAFIEFFVNLARERGGVPVLAESSGFEFDTQATFRVLGVDAFCRRLDLPLVDLDQGGHRAVALGRGLGRVGIAQLALDADLVINLPVLKHHTITNMTGAVKNLFGLLSRDSRRRLHARGLHRAIHALGTHLEARSVHVVDARRSLRRAVFADAEPLGYVLAAEDPFALDHFGCRLLGVAPESVAHLGRVERYFVEGEEPAEFARARASNALAARMRRAVYAAAYAADHVAGALGRASFLPALHWYLGIHPKLRPDLPRPLLERVAQSCPVGAIDVDAGRVDRLRCQRVRCLSCRRAHPALVSLGGFHPAARAGGRC